MGRVWRSSLPASSASRLERHGFCFPWHSFAKATRVSVEGRYSLSPVRLVTVTGSVSGVRTRPAFHNGAAK
jgi:hypothetical protein